MSNYPYPSEAAENDRIAGVICTGLGAILMGVGISSLIMEFEGLSSTLDRTLSLGALVGGAAIAYFSTGLTNYAHHHLHRGASLNH